MGPVDSGNGRIERFQTVSARKIYKFENIDQSVQWVS